MTRWPCAICSAASPAPEFEAWLTRQGLMDGDNRIRPRELPAQFRALLPP